MTNEHMTNKHMTNEHMTNESSPAAQNTTENNSKELVTFIARHAPPLQPGEYTIAVSQTVNQMGPEAGTALTASTEKTIFVAGDHFAIPQAEVVNCFPPPSSTGAYSHTLPHITLKRSTLPWERNPGLNNEQTPWLWLFVFDDLDVAQGHVKPPAPMALNSLFTAAPPYMPEPGEANAQGQWLATPVSVLQLQEAWLQANKLYPTVEDLAHMAFVRQNEQQGTQTEEAVCLANRLPQKGVRSHACLLSLEHRLSASPHQPVPVPLPQEPSPGYTAFVVLHAWSFSCLETNSYQRTATGLNKLQHHSPALPQDLVAAITQAPLPGFYTSRSSFLQALEHSITHTLGKALPQDFAANANTVASCFAAPSRTFEGILQQVEAATLAQPPLPSNSSPQTQAANHYLAQGAVALPHQLATGQQALSWYRGPLATSPSTPTQPTPLPVESAGALLQYNSTLNMLDTTYAAAWALGRQLMLNNKPLSMALFQLKRRLQHEQQPVSAVLHAMAPQKASASQANEVAMLQQWVATLWQGQHMPLNYWVPQANQLPPEALRFFTLDTEWMRALIYGSLSLGGPNTAQVYTLLNQPQTQRYSGILLRSAAVSGWPQLEATAKEAGAPLTPVAKRLLGKEMALFLFKGHLSSATLQLPPEALHFGFEPVDGHPNLYEKAAGYTQANGTLQHTAYAHPVAVAPNNARGIAMAALAGKLATASALSPFTAAQFALEMVMGVPQVTLSINTTDSP